MSTHAFATPDCIKTGEVCTAPNQTRNINGMSVYRDCWEYQDTYQCRSQDMVNDCQPLRDKGCVQVGSTCAERDDGGVCVMYEQSYQCPDKPESFTDKTVCDQSAFCQDGGSGCFDTSSSPDRDFGQAAVMMEASREAGVDGVDPNNVEIFKGYMEECSIKVLGGATIKSCCNSSGGGAGFSNYAMLGAALTVAGEAAREGMAVGSKYVYDSLYNQVDSTIMNKGLGAMNNWAQSGADGVFNPTFSPYGFTFQFTFANGFEFVGFDPTSFAISIAVMLVQEWLSCDQSEQIMSMKRGQNLCVHISTYCSSKVLKICVEKRERWCCFNSKLAKIINRQGRAQLGMDMNSCGGFNQAQLQSLDFSQMDLSEFIADIIPKDVNLNNTTNQVSQTVTNKVNSYYNQ